MNDDTLTKNNDVPKENTDDDSGYSNGKIYDISDDFNISPVEDTAESQDKAEPILDGVPLMKSADGKPIDLDAPIVTPPPSSPSPQAPIKQTSVTPAPTIGANTPGESFVPKSIPENFSFTPGQTFTSPASTSGTKMASSPITTAPPIPGITKPANPIPDAKKVVDTTGSIADKLSQENIPKNHPNIKSLRTYESDIASVLAQKNISTAKIAIAEQSKGQEEQRIANADENKPAPAMRVPNPEQGKSDYLSGAVISTHSNKKFFLILASIVLIFIGVAGAYVLYMKSPIAPVNNTPSVVRPISSSIVPADTQTVLDVTNLVPATIVRAMERELAANQKPGSVREVVLVMKSGENSQRLTPEQAIDKIDIDVPNIISRSLTQDWMIGVYADQNGDKDAFVAVTTNFFQNTFAGMLQWERVLPDDIKMFIAPNSVKGVSSSPRLSVVGANALVLPNTNSASTTGTTTSTTTKTAQASSTRGTSATSTISGTTTPEVPVIPNFVLNGTFQDRIIKNKDVRSFVNTSGRTLFLYSFIDSEHLVIAGKESTLLEIINRLDQKAFVR